MTNTLPSGLSQCPLGRDYVFVLEEVRRNLRNPVFLPVLPEVVTTIQAALIDDAVTFERVERTIRIDAAVAGRFLQVAQSPLYARGKVVSSVGEALQSIGLKTARDLVWRFSVEQLFKYGSPAALTFLKMQWLKTIEVAACAGALAHIAGLGSESTVFLAGTLHRVGVLPVVRALEKILPSLPVDEIEQVCWEMHREAQALLLAHWNLQGVVAQASMAGAHCGSVSESPEGLAVQGGVSLAYGIDSAELQTAFLEKTGRTLSDWAERPDFSARKALLKGF